jgi:Acyl-CoA carboxylase epsilon subunit
MTNPGSGAPVPLLAVTRGTPTAEELAAVVVALASRPAARASGGRGGRPSEWAARTRTLRATVHPGPGAWRASALPG